MRAPSTLSQRLLRFCVHGIMIITPLTLTLVVLRWLFQQADGLL
jgi:uncharacterized membrane protein